ncbi:MAG: response regulator [Myxococcales bacterium]|nr:response regulator [Myxococcales bacterium]
MAKILLVEDSRTMRNLWVRALGEAGNDVPQACDGIEALSKLMKEGFDLVLTDINMPNMDGISLIRAIRRVDKLKSLPVLVVGVDPGEETRKKAMTIGATDWVLKPIDAAKLVSEVERVLGEADAH